jgi:hypothetical protein
MGDLLTIMARAKNITFQRKLSIKMGDMILISLFQGSEFGEKPSLLKGGGACPRN